MKNYVDSGFVGLLQLCIVRPPRMKFQYTEYIE